MNVDVVAFGCPLEHLWESLAIDRIDAVFHVWEARYRQALSQERRAVVHAAKCQPSPMIISNQLAGYCGARNLGGL